MGHSFLSNTGLKGELKLLVIHFAMSVLSLCFGGQNHKNAAL